MTIEELMKESQRIAVAHGFESQVGEVNPAMFSEKLLLMVSELCEAQEEWRKGRRLNQVYFESGWKNVAGGLINEAEKSFDAPGPAWQAMRAGEGRKPEGIPTELADCVIRIAEFCCSNGIDLETAIKLKQEYNEGRPHKHGKKF